MMTLALLGAVAALGTFSGSPKEPFLVGGDVSEIPQIEAEGGTWSLDGKAEDVFTILRKLGWNFVRFRVWNQPRDGYCDKAHTLALAKRAHAQGMKISIDFHYSDWWADPGKQNKPAAWRELSFEDLQMAVRDYTKEVVGELVAQGTPPYMVQIGNEIISGMLWPDGRVRGEDPEMWSKLGKLIQAGIEGVKQAQGKNRILTMIHLDRGADNKGCHWWFDNFAKTGVAFDTIGLSYYPWWHGSLADMEANVNDVAKTYKKDVYIVELGYPWCWDSASGPHVYNGPKVEEGYPATPEGQAAFVEKVGAVVKAIPGGRGKGLLYWAPTWISSAKQHSAYMNLALFDEKGNAIPSAKVLGQLGK